MEDSFTQEIIRKLYKNAKYKQITDLFSFVVKIEKNVNIPVLDRIFKDNYQILSVNAIYWNKNTPEKYSFISSCIKIHKQDMLNFDIKRIRKQLIENIYKQVIEKEIMMI